MVIKNVNTSIMILIFLLAQLCQLNGLGTATGRHDIGLKHLVGDGSMGAVIVTLGTFG